MFIAKRLGFVIAGAATSGALVSTLGACHEDAVSPVPLMADDAGVVGDGSSPLNIGGDRPVTVQVPPGYVEGTEAPLLIMLHGYTANGAEEESYLKLAPVAAARGWLYVTPDGLIDGLDNGYWNATEACCDFGGSKVDDSKYLSDLIVEIQAKYSVDPKRIYFIGHSNGGFMSHRMACDHADKVAAFVSFAGAQYDNVASCKPTEPVNVLQIHGTSDDTIRYDGGQLNRNPYPSAETTATMWATLNGCSTTPDTSSPPIDLVSTIAGSETTIAKYETSCRPGGRVELWTMVGGNHIPGFNDFAEKTFDFLASHPKP